MLKEFGSSPRSHRTPSKCSNVTLQLKSENQALKARLADEERLVRLRLGPLVSFSVLFFLLLFVSVWPPPSPPPPPPPPPPHPYFPLLLMDLRDYFGFLSLELCVSNGTSRGLMRAPKNILE
uniref:Uncharacterized protein n=1 Tax=Populus alba TaxID=43335 RepID=A0A4U5Q2T2_POPAL|nr:hypothetical protein D5086_0000145810 [Populus alba]